MKSHTMKTRVTPEQRDAYDAQAARENFRDTASWVRHHLDAVVESSPADAESSPTEVQEGAGTPGNGIDRKVEESAQKTPSVAPGEAGLSDVHSGVAQSVARVAHTHEVEGSSPSPAIAPDADEPPPSGEEAAPPVPPGALLTGGHAAPRGAEVTDAAVPRAESAKPASPPVAPPLTRATCPRFFHHRPGVYCSTCKS